MKWGAMRYGRDVEKRAKKKKKRKGSCEGKRRKLVPAGAGS